MKMIKIALLGTAALAAVSASAQANSYDALNQDIAAMNFSPVAVADVPAGSSFNVAGYVKAGLVYTDRAPTAADLLPVTPDGINDDGADGDEELDIKTEGGVTFSGSTDTSVGKIGASLTAIFNYDEDNSNISIGNDGFNGYWEFAEGMKLSIGRLGDLASIGHGIESNTNRIFTGAHGTNQGGNGDFASMQLGYSSGPIGFAIALHDTSKDAVIGTDDDAFGVSAEMTYAADIFKIELAGGYYGIDNAAAGAQQKWLAGVGVGINVADGISLGVGAQMGEQHAAGGDLLGFSGSAKIAASDAISFQFGAGWEEVGAGQTTAIVGGIYYSPVAQLTLGLEADWKDTNTAGDTGTVAAALVAKYTF